MHRRLIIAVSLAFSPALAYEQAPESSPAPPGEWKPVPGRVMTRWGKAVTSGDVLREYPRPQMVRKDWSNLNGLWEYAIRPGSEKVPPEKWDGRILVPFCVESALSGVGRRLAPDQALWYRHKCVLPVAPDRRTLLHFGAVDWHARVWVNGKEVGEHRGGYDAFSFDITSALAEGPQDIVVRVDDPTDKGAQPRGKQVLEPNSIWYTAVSGIWQTVWLERVPTAYIRSFRIVPDLDDNRVAITFDTSAPGSIDVEVRGERAQTATVSCASSERIVISLPAGHAWTPDDPFLYHLTARLTVAGKTDEVSSYFALRKIEVRTDESGVNRLFLNNKPLFQFGPLDQGWWPDGLYTAPSDDALKYDLEVTKRLGFNMIRKHVKVEPDRWYYWCDKLGILVWQDMPSGDAYIGGDQPDIARTPESAATYERELKAMIDGLYNHPSIVMWVPYNEGWGQWDTPRICKLIHEWDPTRLVNNASGWTDRGAGDVNDAHVYPGPGMPRLERSRAAVLGEFGGLGLPLAGHTWQEQKNWGYKSFETLNALNDAYLDLLGKLRPLIARGLCAAVYTQTSDVEIECNGLMTYDREITKISDRPAVEAAAALYAPPPIVTEIVPSSQTQPLEWRYATGNPGERWMMPDFDDSAWKSAPAGFGTAGTPGAAARTTWNTPDIWIRRSFDLLDEPPGAAAGELHLLIHHDEDAEVFINGVPAATLTGYVTDYTPAAIAVEAARTLKKGKNLIAIHCRQTRGGQYIDVGLIRIEERPRSP